MDISAINFARPLRRDDIAPLIEVIDATGLFPGDMLPDMAAPYLTHTDPSARWWTYDDGAPLAVAHAAPEAMTSGTWNLLLIAVDPARQREGIGTMLVARVEDDLAALGCRLLLIETSGLPSFEHTRTFYVRRGYRSEARIRDFYQQGEDKIVFAKSLIRSSAA